MTSYSNLFSTYQPCAGNKKIIIEDGFLSAIAGTESIVISHSLTLHNILHVPKLSFNLLSISKVTNDLKCQVNLYSSLCEFQELASGRMIGSAIESGGLCFLEDGSDSTRQVPNTCFVSDSSNSNVKLWHYRFRHPSFHYLKQLFPSLFKNKSPIFISM